MTALVVLGGFAALVILIAWAGLAAERQPRVRAALRRMEPLSPPQRGRLGVWFAKDPQVPALVRLMPLTAFVYWVTPIDFIPDFIPGAGYFDDRIALALATWFATRWAPDAFEEHLARIEYLHEVALARSELPPDASDAPTGG
jgi:uncharacterized membrane protein YkvA (DUF1232 family)